jgi:thioredoxin 1
MLKKMICLLSVFGVLVLNGADVALSTPNPKIAYNPFPSDGATSVDTNVILSWTPGLGAKLHTVYFGDNFDDVYNSAGGIPQMTPAFTPGQLESGKTYYWRVDEFDAVETHKGDVWNFTTLSEIPAIDDMPLVIYYSFDSVTGIVADQSGNGHDGVVRGNVTAESQGKHAGAAKFATGSYLELDGPGFPAEDIPTSAITLAAWVKCVNTGGHHAIFNARASDATWLIHPELRSNGQFRWLLRAYGGLTIFDIRAGSVTWDEWLHFAGTYDKASSKAILYINGEVVREEDATNPRDIAGDWDRGARVGYNIDNARPFTGLMDDFCLFTEALSPANIKKIMQDIRYPFAFNPSPADDARHADTCASLSWIPGFTAVSHDVYFGANFDDVNDGVGGTFQGNQTATTFTVGLPGWPYPDGLVLDTTYYWRIDEVEADGTIHKGDVWSFTISLMEDFETNDFSKFAWSSSGDASWDTTRSERHSGLYSAQAGSIEHGESSTLQVSLDCVSGNISFYRKVSSESHCDYLIFKIDGEEKGTWSGEEDWSEVSFSVNEGTRTFEWTYSKDSSVSEGDDSAWIDDIVFPIGLNSHQPQPEPQPTGEVIVLTDATFNETVLNSDVPVLVDFWAPWCGPCLTMAPVIREIAEEYAGKAKICKLNVDNCPNTTMNYSIRYIPTFILFKDGVERGRWIGVTNKNELTTAIDGLL